jgi:Tol biopolymer transport system component
MGEVFRARDEKLGRDVAVKVLPPGLLANEAARSRFRKEAEALSRLSHPHIATLFDFDSAEGADFLVMELVTGPTLGEELRKGPLAEKEVVRLGAQLARGLQAAHEQGVIHRDLKPSNLQLTADGLLKILDFGVAHLEQAAPREGEATATATETAAGELLGSPPYMAPEQLLGKPVDARTDLYAAGACLYELATGKRPHGDKRGAALTEAILHEAPVAPRNVNSSLPAGLEAVILKALDRDPGLRYQTAMELLVDLERLQAARTLDGTSRLAASTPRHRLRGPVLASATAIAVLVLAWFFRPLPPPRVTTVRPLTGELTLGGTRLAGGAATDGARVYYLARGANRLDLFQVPVIGGDPVQVPLPFGFYYRMILGYVPGESALLMLGATETVSDDAPDFGVPLWLVPVPAGTPRRIPNLRARWADLSRDGRTLALVRGQSGRNHRLYLAGIDGSGERPLIEVGLGVGVVRWAPDGRRLRFTSSGPPGHERERWIWETSIAGEAPRPLFRGQSGAWTQDGRYFVYGGPGGGLLALPEPRHWWDRKREPQPLTIGPISYTFAESDPGGRWLLTMGLMFRGELLRYGAGTSRWEQALGGESVVGVEASADGQWLAWTRLPDTSLWRSRPDGSERLRLTAPGVEARQPRWSADGRRIVFVGRTSDDLQNTVRVIAADASSAGVVARPEDPGADYWDPCWLPDGSIVFSHLVTDRPGAKGLFRYDPGAGRAARLEGAEDLQYPRCSLQGHLLAVGRSGTRGLHYWMRRAGATTWTEVGVFPLSYANWRRDGRSFCGLNWLDRSSYSVDCVSVETGKTDRVFMLGAVVPMVWQSARWTGLDADDQPLVVADRSTTALYALEWEAP